jgi:hypothetical protein
MQSSNNANYNEAIGMFLSFCIEQYKHAKSISGEEAMKSLSETGTLDYLAQNYEVLHTQSPQWILEEINEHINAHTK